MNDERVLAGKTAVITGASSGIGRATAMTLAQAGARVVVQARRKDRLEELAAEIAALGGAVLIVPGNAGLKEDIDLLLHRTAEWDEGGGRCDIVVANAGRGLAGGILESDESQWQELYQTNVLGAAYLMRKVAQRMVEQGSGDIVIVGSVVGRNVSPFSGFYGSSKFAVGGLAEALRREVCSKGVRVSLVMPGIVVSGFQGVAGYTEENFYNGVSAFGKLLEPQAIADGIRWLLTLPPHVNVSEIMIRPTGQFFP